VGESEKNLEDLLKEAKEADAVLFFDEAEGLFRKVKGVGLLHYVNTTAVALLLPLSPPPPPQYAIYHHDYNNPTLPFPPLMITSSLLPPPYSLLQREDLQANHEVRWSNHMLQRVETYEGVLIAATNMDQTIDEAYRLVVVVVVVVVAVVYPFSFMGGQYSVGECSSRSLTTHIEAVSAIPPPITTTTTTYTLQLLLLLPPWQQEEVQVLGQFPYSRREGEGSHMEDTYTTPNTLIRQCRFCFLGQAV